MTALAMMIGMAPMALSAEQNAPLGRAVIGGLLFATIATLFFVPVVFSLVHARKSRARRRGTGRPYKGISRMLEQQQREPLGSKLRRFGLTALIVAIVIAAFGIFNRSRSETQLVHWTQEQAIPQVVLVSPQRGVTGQEIVLPRGRSKRITKPRSTRVSADISKCGIRISARG